MKISEAVEKAVQQEKMIYRRSIWRKTGLHNTLIKPTNSYDACIIISYLDGEEIASCRNWNPTGDDLMANDWELMKSDDLKSMKEECGYLNEKISKGEMSVNDARRTLGLPPVTGCDTFIARG